MAHTQSGRPLEEVLSASGPGPPGAACNIAVGVRPTSTQISIRFRCQQAIGVGAGIAGALARNIRVTYTGFINTLGVRQQRL